MDNVLAMCYGPAEDPNMTMGSFSKGNKTFIILGLILLIKVYI